MIHVSMGQHNSLDIAWRKPYGLELFEDFRRGVWQTAVNQRQAVSIFDGVHAPHQQTRKRPQPVNNLLHVNSQPAMA